MKNGSRLGIGIVAASVLLSAAGPASAQTYTWTNAIVGTQWWSTNINWMGGVAPVAGGAATYSLIFSNSAAANVANNDLSSPFMLNFLRFSSGAMSLSGGTLLFTNNVAAMSVVTNVSGSVRTIANDIVFGTNVTLGGNSFASQLNFTGAAGLGGGIRAVDVSHIQNVYSPSVVHLSGAVGNGGLLKTGNGTLILSGANTYSLGTHVNAGVVQFDSLGAIGGSGANVTNAGGAIGINFAGFMDAVTTRVGQITGGTLAISAANSAESIDFRPALFANAFLGVSTGRVVYTTDNYTPYINTAAAGSNLWKFGGGGGILVVTSAISGTDGVLIGGGGNYGSVVLAGTNSYSGPTTIQNGMLLIVSNSSAVSTPSIAFGATPKIILNGGTLHLANVVVTNEIWILSGANNAQNNGAVLHLWGNTTNEIKGLMVVPGGGSVKINGPSGGLHIFSGGIVSTNVGFTLYDDAFDNKIIVTNKPILLGTGILAGHNLHIGVENNVVGGLNINWGRNLFLTVSNAFVGAPTLSIGTGGADTVNGVDLNTFNLRVSSMTANGNSASSSNKQFVTGAAGSLFTLTNGPGHGARSTGTSRMESAWSRPARGCSISAARMCTPARQRCREERSSSAAAGGSPPARSRSPTDRF